MSGLPDLNRHAFSAAEKLLAGRGYTVYNPALVERAEWGYDACLDFDLTIIEHWADVVVRLPGWADSSGALSDSSKAQQEHIPVFDVSLLSTGMPRTT